MSGSIPIQTSVTMHSEDSDHRARQGRLVGIMGGPDVIRRRLCEAVAAERDLERQIVDLADTLRSLRVAVREAAKRRRESEDELQEIEAEK